VIPADNVFALLAVLLGVSALGVSMENTRLGKHVSGVMIVIGLSIVLANTGVIPRQAPLYDVIWVYLIPFAIALFLIKADLVSIITKGGRVLAAFVIGTVGICAGALLGSALLDLGESEASLAAVFTATYTGGSLNFAGVADMIDFRDSSLLAAAIAIDNVLGVVYFVVIGAATTLTAVRRRYPWRIESIISLSEREAGPERAPTPSGLLSALALAALACAAGIYLANALGFAGYSILFITAIMVALATVARSFLSALTGAEMFAMLFMYLFFAILGAGADIVAMFGAALPIFLFVIVLLTTHLVLVALGARLFRINYAEACIGSLACVGGPPVAVAFAVLYGWRSLALPGVLTGVLGYVAGSFIGVAVFRALSA
jgi:uncharacterized membrane protein